MSPLEEVAEVAARGHSCCAKVCVVPKRAAPVAWLGPRGKWQRLGDWDAEPKSHGQWCRLIVDLCFVLLEDRYAASPSKEDSKEDRGVSGHSGPPQPSRLFSQVALAREAIQALIRVCSVSESLKVREKHGVVPEGSEVPVLLKTRICKVCVMKPMHIKKHSLSIPFRRLPADLVSSVFRGCHAPRRSQNVGLQRLMWHCY